MNFATLAQSTFEIVRPVVEKTTEASEFGYEILNAGIKSKTDQTRSISFKLKSKVSPEEWMHSICGPSTCFTPFISESGKDNLEPKSTEQLFEVNWSSVSPGDGVIEYEVWDTDKPSDKVLVTFKMKVNAPLSTMKSAKFSNIKLYPNPSNDEKILNLDLANHKFENLSLTDLTGRVVLEQAIGGQMLNISLESLTKGLYVITLTGKETYRNTIQVK